MIWYGAATDRTFDSQDGSLRACYASMTTCGRLHDNRPEETRVPGSRAARSRPRSLSPWLRFIVVALYLPLSALFKLRWRGVENVPAAGPAILVINHVSYADPLVVARYVYDAGRAPRFLAKRESVRLLPVVGAAFRGTGQIPVDRGTSAARQSLKEQWRRSRRGRS